MYCDYTTCGPSGGGGKAFQCIDGRFKEIMGPSCNPPPVCPVEEPTRGSTCLTGGFGGCSYADKCVDRPSDAPANDFMHCAGTWTLSGPDYVAKCPSVQPLEGSSCRCGQHFYGTCSYGSCGGLGSISAKCDTTSGLWSVITSTCNPPAPDAGSGESGSAEAGSAEVGPGR